MKLSHNLLPFAALIASATLASSFIVIPQHDIPQVFIPADMSTSGTKNPPIVMSNGPILSDAMSIQRDISLFAEFARASAMISDRFDDINQNTTVLAPLNSVIKALPRKPWEDPDPSEGADSFSGLAGEGKAARNLQRFVEAHIVPVSPFEEKQKVKTLAGREIWWEMDGDTMKIYPDGIKVRDVRTTVPNGQIWTVEAVINY